MIPTKRSATRSNKSSNHTKASQLMTCPNVYRSHVLTSCVCFTHLIQRPYDTNEEGHNKIQQAIEPYEGLTTHDLSQCISFTCFNLDLTWLDLTWLDLTVVEVERPVHRSTVVSNRKKILSTMRAYWQQVGSYLMGWFFQWWSTYSWSCSPLVCVLRISYKDHMIPTKRSATKPNKPSNHTKPSRRPISTTEPKW